MKSPHKPTDVASLPRSRVLGLRSILLTGTALLSGILAGPVPAQDLSGGLISGGSTHSLPIGENTEVETAVDRPAIPFMISVDGVPIDGSIAPESLAPGTTLPGSRPVDHQRQTDVGLSAVDIQVKFDGLDVQPILNISTVPVRRAYLAGEEVLFLATANYPAFVDRAEIRIYESGAEAGRHPIDIVPVSLNGTAGWMVPYEGGPDFAYVLRVYDATGRYDETLPLTLHRSSQDLPSLDTQPEAVAPGMGEDRTAFRNIPVNGGAVTVYGRHVPPGYSVEVLGDSIPLDPEQAFVAQRILPPGDHVVDVAVTGTSKSGGLSFSRDINIPQNDWFYVALADLTIGKRFGDDLIETVRTGEYDDVYTKGRLAFYLKGKIKGEYLLTAATDTGEEDLDEIFRDLDGKDPRQLLRRLDPDDYYPVYGDDSTFKEDAPTNGKFYVRLERGDSHVMWGNYKTEVKGTEFLRSDRALYGASAVYRSEVTTSFGERRTEVTAYAAQPETLPQREEFSGTGGSAYFLRRQDIVEGSETVAVEIRDRVSGRVIERRVLAEGEDYYFDYMQGVIILRRPLMSATGTGGPVRDGALGGERQVLTVQYEFEPVAGDIDGYVYGGRAQHWLNEKVRVGVTGMDEGTGTADQQAYGADVILRHTEDTYLSAEVARSKGPGFGKSRSIDGGLTWSSQGTTGHPDHEADAWRVEGQVALEDVAPGLKGQMGGYYEEKEAGFSTLYDQISSSRRIWGAHAALDLTDRLGVKLIYDDFTDDDGKSEREGTGSVSYEFDEHWKVSFGVSYTELMSPTAVASGKSGYNGSRLDAGVRVDYRIDDDRLVYAFAQGTVDRSGDIHRNNRAGAGGQIQLTDKIGLTGELSYGTHGLGALAGVTYDPTADDHHYLGYRLDPDRAFDLDRDHDLFGTDHGALVAGARRRLGETASAYAENSYDMFGERRSLAQTYGVLYTPDAMWTLDAGLEIGRVRDDTLNSSGTEHSDLDRYAPSLSVAYKDEEAGIKAHVRGEVRIERSEDETRDQNTYLLAAGMGWKANPDWRAIANVDAVLSDTQSDETSFTNTDYIEASLGYAYRPVNHDRLNALFKYTWLYDLPGNNQVISAATGDLNAPAQRSHILSADVIYDIVPWLSIGGKYGVRVGEVRYRVNDGAGTEFEDEWQRSTAHLGILRTDLHVVKNWDMLLEGRVLHMAGESTDFGALAAVYRHVGDNFKVGLGYNFGRFSDDLRDLTLDDQGVFLNVIGKF